VSAKKAKAKGKATAKKAADEKGTPKASKQVDMGQVRENINNLVGNSARKIAIEVIKVALTGQLATAKYLFEAVGLYPPTEQTEVRPIETTLAHTLLTRMGLPLEPVVYDEDETPDGHGAVKGAVRKAIEAAGEVADGVADKDPGAERDEHNPLPAEGEE
jgi:hypothetical protein